MSRYPHDAKVYVGELGNNASKQEIEDAFSYYGPLRNVWVARNPPGFAFVEFEDARDAEDSVRGLDGRTICGRRARVELSTGKGGRGFRGGGGGGGAPRGKGGRGNFHPDDRCYECGGRGHYARDCTKRGRSKGRKRSRSRSPRSRSRELRTRSKSYSRSRSRDRDRERDRDRRTRSKTPKKSTRDRSVSRDRTKSPRRSKTRSRSRSRTPRSVTRSRSRSHRRNGASHHD